MGISFWRYNFSLTILMVGVFSSGVVSMMTAFRSGPEDTVIREGDTAVMRCSIDHGVTRGPLQWYRVTNDNVFTVLSADDAIKPNISPATGSYDITGDHQAGQYNLRITGVDRRDSGVYHCRFKQGPSREIVSVGAELTVVVPPSITSPSCIMMDASDSSSFSTSPPPVFSVGDTPRLACLSSGGVPPASLIWMRSGARLTGKTTRSNIVDYLIEESDLDVEFTCYADSPALDAPRSCSLILARRPRTIRIMPERPVVSLGGGITLSCEAEGIPPDEDAVWQWFFNGDAVPRDSDPPRRFSVSSDNKSLTVGLVAALDDSAEILCQLTAPNDRTATAMTLLQVEGIITPSTAVDMDMSSATDISPYNATTDDVGAPSDMAPAVKTYLIIASSIAGVAIAALAIILIAFIYRRHAKSKRRNANSNNPESNPTSTPDVRTKKMSPVSPANRNRKRIDPPAQLAPEGDYTALQGPTRSAAEYQSIRRSPPTAPRPYLAPAADNDMCWDYEIPYTVDTLNNVRPNLMHVTNQEYLEIM